MNVKKEIFQNKYYVNNKFYVYVLLDPRKHGKYKYGKYKFSYEPFYVGKGCGRRIQKSVSPIEKFNPHKTNKIKKILQSGLKPLWIKLITNLTEKKSFKTEKQVIRDIGRQNIKKGPLTNLTEGGIGPSMTEETKKKISDANKGRTSPMKGMNQSLKAKLQMSKNNAKYWKNKSLPPKSINKMKKTKTKHPQDFSYELGTYMATSPNGTTYTITNGLRRFCEKHNLTRSKMVSVSTNNRPHHKGWKCVQIKHPYSINDYKYKLTNNMGQTFIIKNIRRFAKNKKLSVKRLIEVAKKKHSVHRGWQCEYYKIP